MFKKRNLKREVLRQVNEIRLVCNNKGLEEIPDGIRKSRGNCPIAVALSNGVTANVGTTDTYLTFPSTTAKKEIGNIAYSLRSLGFKAYPGRQDILLTNTKEMKEFIALFDTGKLKI